MLFDSPLSESLDAQIVRLAPCHTPAPWAPDSFARLMTYENTLIAGQPLPVFHGGCERTIYGSPTINYAVRAWHDSLHIKHRLDFIEACECAVGLLQVAAISGAYEKRLIWADTIGQTEYYARYGEFVCDQRAFVLAYIAAGNRLTGRY